MYSKVEIRGFRGADNITLDKLGQINILVGKNNVGKSSCLEAISLLASGSAGFHNAFRENSLKQVLGRRVHGSMEMEYLQHTGAAETRIVGYKTDGSGADNLIMSESPYGTKPSIDADLIERLHSKMKIALKPDEVITNQTFFYFYGQSRVLGVLYLTNNGLTGLAAVDPTKNGAPERPQSMFVNLGALDNLHDRLTNLHKLHDVIQQLREKHPDMKDMQQIRDTLCVLKDHATIPLRLAGDGLRASVAITSGACALERGVLVLEEPEKSMHPGLVFRLVDDLLSACKNNDIQIFISSHSDELIKSALEMHANTKLAVHHVGRFDEEPFVESFDALDAKDHRLNLELDLRGL